MSLDVNILSKITISNPLEMNYKSNQDALDLVDTGSIKRIVVCDGAGGAGVFCGDWAQTAAQSVPADPAVFKSNFETWYQCIGESFHDHITRNKDLSDPVLVSKFYQKGSFTTLLALWIDTENTTYTCAGIGDSLFFHFQKQGNWALKSVFPLKDVQNIQSNPRLLSWGAETVAIPHFEEHPIYEDSIFILCSDSIARWILIMLDVINPGVLVQAGLNNSFQESLAAESIRSRKEIANTNLQLQNTNELLNYLRTITQTEVEFRNAALNMIQSGSLEEDDLTIAIVEVNVSQRI
jgi:hypothetical protein